MVTPDLAAVIVSANCLPTRQCCFVLSRYPPPPQYCQSFSYVLDINYIRIRVLQEVGTNLSLLECIYLCIWYVLCVICQSSKQFVCVIKTHHPQSCLLPI